MNRSPIFRSADSAKDVLTAIVVGVALAAVLVAWWSA